MLAGLNHDTVTSLSLEELCDVFRRSPVSSKPFDSELWSVVYHLGCASNCLKNRPWKQDHKLVDIEKFHGYMKSAFFQMISVFVLAGMGAEDIFNMYYRKSEVNKFRQRSNY